MAVGVFGPGEQGARADPGAEQGEDEDEGGQGATGDQVICLGFYLGDAGEGDAQQGDDDDAENQRVNVH